VLASVTPAGQQEVTGRFVRVDLPGKDRVLALAEVQVFGNGDNLAPTAEVSQSSTAGDSVAKFASDGKTNGNGEKTNVAAITQVSENPWWELDLRTTQPVERVVGVEPHRWPMARAACGRARELLDEKRAVVWTTTLAQAPAVSADLAVSGVKPIRWVSVHADVTEDGFSADSVLSARGGRERGWAVGAERQAAPTRRPA